MRILVLLYSALLVLVAATQSQTQTHHDGEESQPLRRRLADTEKALTEHEKLLKANLLEFQHVDEIQVLGPSRFPPPTDYANRLHPHVQKIVPYMQPYLGQHRPEKDAVFAYAAEYGLNNYICFVESLRETGFDGDIVLSISSLDVKNARVYNYLESVPNIVLYVPDLVCYTFELEQVASAKGGMRTCQCNHLYGHYEGEDLTPIPDPRSPRTVAIIRYEIYWIMSQHYDAHSWILLVDARDTFFQSNPFTSVPRAPLNDSASTPSSGLLYFFGENMQATRLGKSKSNSKWLLAAYGEIVANFLAHKPTICSGASLGQAVAIEEYARAVVGESDDTRTVLLGADQGFHNFLYYSHKLAYSTKIDKIVVFDQGTGIVNNMGALRTQALETWGNGKIVRKRDDEYQVLNWDGTLTPVVHQFDRHKVLSDYFFKTRTEAYLKAWRQRQDDK